MDRGNVRGNIGHGCLLSVAISSLMWIGFFVGLFALFRHLFNG